MKIQKTSSIEKVRLDKWLWAARFFKTRSMARDMVQGGKVQYNGQRVKPGRVVEVGAEIKITQGYDVKTVHVVEVGDKRVSAPLAQKMYQETEDSVKLRETNAIARKSMALHSPRPDSRPDKKQRRALIKFKHTE